MANADNINNHVQSAIARLIEQYKGKPRIKGLITAFVDQVQELEDVLFDLRDDRSLNNATGATLDNIGSIVGVTRIFGESDTAYRIRIKNGIFTNRAQGTPEVLIDLVKTFCAPNTNIYFFEGAVASFGINHDDQNMTQATINGLYKTLKNSKAAGVRIEHVTAFDPSNAFSFAGDSLGGGFGDSNNTNVGGKFAALQLET
jgi:hypothetical protein